MCLQAATKPPQSIERMLYVAAFAVSSYSGTNNRFLKPFNPLLGETFDFEYPEQNWRGLAEKVWLARHCIIALCTHFWFAAVGKSTKQSQPSATLMMPCCQQQRSSFWYV